MRVCGWAFAYAFAYIQSSRADQSRAYRGLFGFNLNITFRFWLSVAYFGALSSCGARGNESAKKAPAVRGRNGRDGRWRVVRG